MSSRRSSVGVGVLGGLLYAVGGYDGASRHCLSSVECYNAVTKEWSLVCDMSTRRSGAGVGVSLFFTQEKLFSFLEGRLCTSDLCGKTKPSDTRRGISLYNSRRALFSTDVTIIGNKF